MKFVGKSRPWDIGVEKKRERIEREMGERKWNGGWRSQVDGGRQDG